MQYMFIHQNFMRNLENDFSMQNFALKVLILHFTRKSVQNSFKLGNDQKRQKKAINGCIFSRISRKITHTDHMLLCLGN